MEKFDRIFRSLKKRGIDSPGELAALAGQLLHRAGVDEGSLPIFASQLTDDERGNLELWLVANENVQ